MKVVLLHFGFEDYSIELANNLHELVDLTVIQPDSLASKRHYINPAIQVIVFKKYRARDPRSVLSTRSITRIINEINPDIIHIQETNDPWYDLSLLVNNSFPKITTIHDVFRHPGDRDLIPGSDFTRQITIFRSRGLIVHGSEQKEKLFKRFPQLSSQVNILPHGELGSLYKRFLDVDSSVTREPYTLLFFGRIWPYKGLSYLLKAMALIIQEIPPTRLIIAGQGEDLQQYSHILSDEEHYTLLNRFIPDDEVTQLFLRSTAVILPYIEASQSGVASIAFGLGTPVIASSVGGLGESIHHNIDGLLVPPRDVNALANAIIRLLKDHDLQHRIQTASLARARDDLSWAKIASQTLEMYEKVLEEV